MSATAVYACDSSWHRHADGTTLVAGSPLGVFSLSEAGVRVARALESGSALPEFHRPLTSRLEAAGAIHPLASPIEGALEHLVTVVIPAYITSSTDHEVLEQKVADLAQRCQVIVVDDCSPIPIVATKASKTIRLSSNRGPGASRNAGLDVVSTPFVAFVDCDVKNCGDALALLVATCAMDGVGLAAPRVMGASSRSRLARYEATHSPLDLGTAPGRVVAGSRISYVPSAMWVVRAEAARALNGFDDSMRVGEDVDFVWRLNRNGWVARYEPRAVVLHDPRPTLRAFVVQRARYGTSASQLAERHPSLLYPLRMSWHSFALWVTFFIGFPIVSGILALYTFLALARRLRHLEHGVRESARLVLRGHWSALTSIIRVLRREWFPLTLLGLSTGGYVSALALAVFLVPSISDYLRRPKLLDPVTFIALRIIDDAAYGLGVLFGCIRNRTIKPLLPDLRTWRANVS